MEKLFCLNCKHSCSKNSRWPVDAWTCFHPNNVTANLVSGEKDPVNTCQELRLYGAPCGEYGLWHSAYKKDDSGEYSIQYRSKEKITILGPTENLECLKAFNPQTNKEWVKLVSSINELISSSNLYIVKHPNGSEKLTHVWDEDSNDWWPDYTQTNEAEQEKLRCRPVSY